MASLLQQRWCPSVDNGYWLSVQQRCKAAAAWHCMAMAQCCPSPTHCASNINTKTRLQFMAMELTGLNVTSYSVLTLASNDNILSGQSAALWVRKVGSTRSCNFTTDTANFWQNGLRVLKISIFTQFSRNQGFKSQILHLWMKIFGQYEDFRTIFRQPKI